MRESRYPEYHTGFNPYSAACGIMHINDTVSVLRPLPGGGPTGRRVAEIARILATFGIGISATSSLPSHIDEGGAPWNDLVFILHSCPWGQLQKALGGNNLHLCVAAGTPRPACNTFFLNPNPYPVTWLLSFKNLGSHLAPA